MAEQEDTGDTLRKMVGGSPDTVGSLYVEKLLSSRGLPSDAGYWRRVAKLEEVIRNENIHTPEDLYKALITEPV